MKYRFDKKAQMMDAGTAFFRAKEGYGTVLGQIKAEMEEYGKVVKASEMDKSELPYTTKECDLFLDFSNILRNRYISCLLEDSGDTGEVTEDGEHIRNYAAVFKEGNTSTVFRGSVAAIKIALFSGVAIYGFINCAILGVAGIACALGAGYFWIMPSRVAEKTVKALKQKIEKSHSRGSNPRPAHYE